MVFLYFFYFSSILESTIDRLLQSMVATRFVKKHSALDIWIASSAPLK